ncbi:tetratricopeptide repeat protein [Niveibacterium sp.]|uniref:tetratricopeptide repeat protein n=1 Tax=Niveibacterium sp. TaxID=2017444 RepID=UPI0035AF1CF4
MSLLIDALRKAEANRQQVGSGNATTAAEVAEALTLEPIDLDSADLPKAAPANAPRSAAGAPRPPLPSATASATAAADEAARRNARQLFSAKPVRRMSPAWWAAGIGAVIAAAGVGYVWWQTQPHSLGVVSPASGIVPTRVAGTAELPTEPPMQAPTPTAPERAAQPASAPVRQAAETSKPARSTRQSVSDLVDSNAAAVSVRSGGAAARSPAAVAIDTAYAAYERGDLVVARALYQEALRSDPRAADALNGLAATALRQGQAKEAEQYFARALMNNPQDPVASAGMLALGREADPMAAESRLKTAIAEQPDSASNHFALGNLQATAGRWNEAQQAYFRAHTLEPDNPDYLFNLAVALDRVNQPRLARQYYERALQAADKRPAAFDRGAAMRRAQSLATP